MNQLTSHDHNNSTATDGEFPSAYNSALTHSSNHPKLNLIRRYHQRVRGGNSVSLSHQNISHSILYGPTNIGYINLQTLSPIVTLISNTSTLATAISNNQLLTYPNQVLTSPLLSSLSVAISKSTFIASLSTSNSISAHKVESESESSPLLSQTDAKMDGRGIEIIVSDENDARVSTVHSGNRAMLRRVWMILLDNRVAGRPDSERALRPHPEEYRVLKRVLNIIFVTIGVALLISVFVVIMYTYVGE